MRAGESIHIRHPSLRVGGPPLLKTELDKIDRIRHLGFNWYLSYVYDQKHVDTFREVVGDDVDVVLKIENMAGLKFAASYRPAPRTRLLAARGDLFVEVPRPHDIVAACRGIINVDHNAMAGSRMLLSLITQDVPNCADLCEVAWLYEIGYNSFLLCDELCLKEELLGKAVNVFCELRSTEFGYRSSK